MSNHNATTNTTNDQSRIQWTPLVERYFVDLMLEQKRRGNRAGHTFKKEAWKEMQKMFSTKFAFGCDKDSMKLYYANLWNRFNSVKNILCHKDFTWDDSTQMVVADDQVWDAYIQAYPNAQKYRIRPVLNYGDLCEIFDNTNADGRYSISSHDASIGVGMQELNLGDGEGGSSSQRIVWSAAMDQLFIKLLLQKLRENNGSINTNAWADMLTVFKANFGFQHGRHILRHRFTKYYKYFSEMSNILNTKGFSWDSQTQIITADDHIWKAYIKEHRYARKYLENTFPNYDDLELLFRSMSENEVRRLRQERNYNHGATQIEDGDGDGNPNPRDTNEGRIRWTLTMDHYFIDLLLEQMKFGNKVGNTYNPQAWNAIVKSFNERFKTHYGKENLRNHYKHFKRQFSVVSNILQLKEFTWDDTKEMVVAEDHVWDAYIKENHEARSVRTKGLHGYSKLCAILAEESSETRHSSSSQNIDHLNVETQILSTEGIEKEMEQQSYGFTFFDEENHDIQDIFSYLEMDEVEWTEAMEVYFIELMVEQVNMNISSGNNIGRSFSEEAWTRMTEAFSTRMGFQYHKHFLEEQFVCLMYRHQNMTDLLNSTGLASDQTLQITLATTQVWEAQLQNNQEAISSKLKSLRLFHDLCKIFGNKLTEGTASDIMQQLHIMDGANNISTRNSEMSQHVKKRANTMASSSEPELVKKKKNKKMKSFESALHALLELKDMDEDLVMEACDLLEDEKKAMTFLTLDVSMRKKWLLRKLRP
ncbi:unnamed protein product [Lupinus luteus]|uniref:Myb/SANT-like domain-containing protein n=1 Tax=Lupinus luteus TaxID=3873 RepID=A0AAV1YJK3_LUPLU